VLVGDVAYACALGQSELLRRGEGRERPERLPRVMVSALPILDPLVPGRMENVPNNLAYVPQMGTTFSNRMVRGPGKLTPNHTLILVAHRTLTHETVLLPRASGQTVMAIRAALWWALLTHACAWMRRAMQGLWQRLANAAFCAGSWEPDQAG
jgi:hypothetical protein